jgi:hypothetical protein
MGQARHGVRTLAFREAIADQRGFSARLMLSRPCGVSKPAFRLQIPDFRDAN